MFQMNTVVWHINKCWPFPTNQISYTHKTAFYQLLWIWLGIKANAKPQKLTLAIMIQNLHPTEIFIPKFNTCYPTLVFTTIKLVVIRSWLKSMRWARLQNRLGIYPNSKVQGANMGPIWGQQDPGGSHVAPMNFAIWVVLTVTAIWGESCSTCVCSFLIFYNVHIL